MDWIQFEAFFVGRGQLYTPFEIATFQVSSVLRMKYNTFFSRWNIAFFASVEFHSKNRERSPFVWKACHIGRNGLAKLLSIFVIYLIDD